MVARCHLYLPASKVQKPEVVQQGLSAGPTVHHSSASSASAKELLTGAAAAGAAAAVCRLVNCTRHRPASRSLLGAVFCLLWQLKIVVRSMSAPEGPEVGTRLARR